MEADKTRTFKINDQQGRGRVSRAVSQTQAKELAQIANLVGMGKVD